MKKPKKLYISLYRDGCDIFTDTNEMITMKCALDVLARRITNFSTYKINDKQYQDIEIVLDRSSVSCFFMELLKSNGVKSTIVNNGNRLIKHMSEQMVLNDLFLGGKHGTHI